MIEPVVILGAGLTGLSAAYGLGRAGQPVRLLEARAQPGGRIYTSGDAALPLEMGATWFGPKHPLLGALLAELGLPAFEQHSQGVALFEATAAVPPQAFRPPVPAEPTYRIAGGSAALIARLAAAVGPARIEPNWRVQRLEDRGDHVAVLDGAGREVRARRVVSTIPPAVLGRQVQFAPALPAEVMRLLGHTHTWMSGTGKVAVGYAAPFWRQRGLSGAVFSQAGPVAELHDHCNAAGTGFALMGFLAAGTEHLAPTERRRQVLAQLVRLFGPEAAACTHYHDHCWTDALVHTPGDDALLPHQHNGHAGYRPALFGGKLWLAGTETAPHFGGYMEGAVWSGQAVCAAQLAAAGPPRGLGNSSSQ